MCARVRVCDPTCKVMPDTGAAEEGAMNCTARSGMEATMVSCSIGVLASSGR